MGERLYKWILKDGKKVLGEPIDSFTVKVRKSNSDEVFNVTENNFGNCRPINCVTAWELQRDYGISKQKTSKAAREGKLNAFMLGMESVCLLKWYIERDLKLEQFITDNDCK